MIFGTNRYLDDDRLQSRIEIMRGYRFEPLIYKDDSFVEISDATSLCRNPLVSVKMITYNHEAFIAKAIEGVVSQECEFEFELIIGDDCSTDATLKIAKKYQQKYPSIIRILTATENSAHRFGNYSANYRRVSSVCRGDLLASCEGDDWWCDEHKLSKQVAVFREHPTVSFCWTRSKAFIQNESRFESAPAAGFKDGLSPSRKLLEAHLSRSILDIRTASFMWRRKDEEWFYDKIRYYEWSTKLGDIPLMLMVSSRGDVFRLEDTTMVYRVHSGSASHTGGGETRVDNICLTAYFSYLLWHIPLCKFPQLSWAFRERMIRIARGDGKKSRWYQFRSLFKTGVFLPVLINPMSWLYWPLAFMAGCGFPRLETLVRHGFYKTISRQIRRRILRKSVYEQ